LKAEVVWAPVNVKSFSSYTQHKTYWILFNSDANIYKETTHYLHLKWNTLLWKKSLKRDFTVCYAGESDDISLKLVLSVTMENT
jgi:hypothetical protein